MLKRRERTSMVKHTGFMGYNDQDRAQWLKHPFPLLQRTQWVRHMLKNMGSRHKVVRLVGNFTSIARLRNELCSQAMSKPHTALTRSPDRFFGKVAYVYGTHNAVERDEMIC